MFMQDYYEMIIQEINIDELADVLIGKKKKIAVPDSELIPGYLATDYSVVLRKVYNAYITDSAVKDRFEKALSELCMRGAYEFYLAFLYIYMAINRENDNSATFRISKSFLNAICDVYEKYEKELVKGIFGIDGLCPTEPLKHIHQWNKNLRDDYGLNLIPKL